MSEAFLEIWRSSIQNLSLRTRVLATFLVLFAVAAAGPAGAWFLLQNRHAKSAAVINEAGRQRMLVQKMLTLSYMVAVEQGAPRDELLATAAQYDETLSAFQQEASKQSWPTAPTELQPQLQKVRSLWKSFRDRLAVIAKEPRSSEAFHAALSHVRREANILLRETDRTVQLYEVAHERQVEKIERFIVGSLGALGGVVCLFLFFAERHVLRPLSHLERDAAAVARGNLEREISVVDMQDEIGSLMRSVCQMKEKLLDSLRETELFRTAVEASGHCIYWTDRDGTIEYVNSAFEEITGYDREEALQETPRILQSGEHSEAFYEDFWDTITNGEVWNGEIVDQRPDGEEYVMKKTVAPIQNGSQQIEHFVAVGTDITRQKEREQALVEAKEEAEAANQLKTTFLANMSHEIRTPLTSIIGFAEAIREEVSDLEDQGTEMDLSALGRFARLIDESGHRLLNTLNGVLNLSKLEAGEMNLRTQEIDLTEQVRTIAEELRPQIEEAGLDLHVEMSSGPVWAHAEEGGLQIVLRNLISNAIKYTEAGGQVGVQVCDLDNEVLLEVEDTGIGMDPGHVSELFEPFRQASEGRSREYEGTGLGLALTRRAVEEMNGTIEVETEKGKGSRFTVRLPRTDAPVSESSATKAGPLGHLQAIGRGGSGT